MKEIHKKSIFRAIVAMSVALVFLTPVTAFANIDETGIENQSVVGVPITRTCISSVEATKERILPTQFTTTSEQILGVDFPLFSTENDCQNPGIVTDGLGNVLVLTEDLVSPSATSVWGRWSTDCGENWVDESQITGWQFPDNVERPKIDYKEGMTSWGTLTPGSDLNAVAFYIDFPDITDPAVPSPTSPQGWTAWSVDWGEAYDFSWFDSADVASYPYTPGKSPSANFFGLVAITGDNPPGAAEDDTFMFSFMIASGQVTIVYFSGMDEDVEKISCDIDQSLAQYYWVCEYVSETDPMDDGSMFTKAPVFDGTDEWWKGASGFPGFLFAGVYNPSMVAADGSVYIVGENAENDIVCMYSSNAGVSFDSSDVTDTVSSESYPTVAIVEDEIVCSYIRNGDLYVSISDDGGQTWTETVDPINDETGTVVDQYCSVAMDGPYVAWTDARNDPTEIYFDTTIEPPKYPILEITEVKGGLGVKATVKNTGEAAATNVTWSVSVTGGFLGRIDKTVGCTIPSLAVDEESDPLKTGIFFGLGKIVAEVTVTCDEGSSDSETKTGMQIIIFTKII